MAAIFSSIAIQAVTISSTAGDDTLASAVAAEAVRISTPVGDETILQAPIASSIAGVPEGDGGGTVQPTKSRKLIIQD